MIMREDTKTVFKFDSHTKNVRYIKNSILFNLHMRIIESKKLSIKSVPFIKTAGIAMERKKQKGSVEWT